MLSRWFGRRQADTSLLADEPQGRELHQTGLGQDSPDDDKATAHLIEQRARELGLISLLEEVQAESPATLKSAVAFCEAEGATSFEQLVKHGLADAFITALSPLGRIAEGRLREIVSDWPTWEGQLQQREAERLQMMDRESELREAEQQELEEEAALRRQIYHASEGLQNRIEEVERGRTTFEDAADGPDDDDDDDDDDDREREAKGCFGRCVLL